MLKLYELVYIKAIDVPCVWFASGWILPHYFYLITCTDTLSCLYHQSWLPLLC